MRNLTLAANWKMNGSRQMAVDYFETLRRLLGSPAPAGHTELIIAAPFTLLPTLVKLAETVFPLTLAAQNVHWEQAGAYTGEVSLAMLADLGIKTVLVAHSERRQYFNENDSSAARKVKACLAAGVRPILCIGESLAERQAGQTAAVIKAQLARVFAELDTGAGGLMIAYEPVWAIGTGLAASPQQAADVHRLIREQLSAKFGAPVAAALPILYGGSMNPDNTTDLLQEADIDGGLIGGASLKAESFAAMYKQATALRSSAR